MSEDKKKKLTVKEQVFVNEYLKCFNGAQAARAANYSKRSIYSIASENLRKPHIRAEIERRLAEVEMSSVEVLARLSTQARGSQEPFVQVDENGNVSFDFSSENAKQNFHLIKKFEMQRKRRVDKNTSNEWEDENVRIELHDPQRALELLGKYHKLFADSSQQPMFNLQIDYSKLTAQQVIAIKNAKSNEEILAIISDPSTS